MRGYNRTLKRCYSSKYAPHNAEHNCILWRYDHEEGIYLKALSLRILTNLTSPMATFCLSIKLSKFLAKHDVIHNNFIGLIQYLTLIIALPIIIADSKAILKANDAYYQLFSRDILLDDAKLINGALDALLRMPSSIKNYFITPFEDKVAEDLESEIGIVAAVLSGVDEHL